MPRKDGTGPSGSGKPGRGLGPCKQNQGSDNREGSNPQGGGGNSSGRGCGRRGNKKKN